jgi:ATP-dependent helicase YprA (DUF1998 family)
MSAAALDALEEAERAFNAAMISNDPAQIAACVTEDWVLVTPALVCGQGLEPRAHQLELLARAEAGESTLLIAPTGAGKTLAGFLPSLTDLTRRGKAAGLAFRASTRSTSRR